MKSKILKLLTIAMVLSIIALPVSAGSISNPFNRTGAKFSLQSSDLTVVGVPNVVADIGPSSLKPGSEGADESQIYLVRLQEPALASYSGGINGLAPTSPQVTGARELDAQSSASQAYVNYLEARHDAFRSSLESRLGREVEFVYQYFTANNGVALSLTPEEAELVASLPEVVYMQPDKEEQLHTDNGPAWIGAPSIWDGTATGGLPGTMGEGIVVGVIDTGINPSNPSFADVGDDSYNHTNPRGINNYVGVCNPAESSYDPTFPCNDKLIGAWGYSSVNGGDPRDYDGHGSHTASTAAGNFVDEATVVGPTITVTRTISGVAPHANVIAYSACCTTSALTAAIDQIIFDNVDVVNYSIGSTGCTASPDPWTDFDAYGYLNARAAGIFVATSAGNCGPGANTVGSPADAPWLTSVAASTHDRKLVNALIDMSGGDTSPPADIPGKSLTSGYGPAPIVYAGDFPNANDLMGDPEQCLEPYPAGTWTNGEIVVCDRGTIARVDKGANVLAGGAGGLVLANDAANADSLNGDAHFLPAVHISYDDGVVLKDWLDTGTGHTASIAGTTLDISDANADILAAFSSRGANKALADIVVPSITAPGVDILAAEGTDDDIAWGFISGTSMSSPHIAGVGALMMSLHPTWTPAEIQSALMTTSYTDLLKEDGATPADPFDMGSGRVDLTQAGEAGLVMNETLASYWNANPATGGDPGTLNLASFGDGSCYQECGWTRSFRSTLGVESTWEISATAASPDMEITLSDTGVTVAAGGTFSLDVDVDVIQLAPESWHFGEVVLSETSDAAPDAHLPIAVYVSSSTDLAVLSKVVDKSEAVVGSTLTYSITLQNPVPVSNTYTLTDTIPSNATYVDGSATGGLVYDAPTDTLTWTGELGPSGLNIAETNISGYVSLAGLGVPPFSLPSNTDDGGLVLSGLDFFYMGEHYSTAIWSINGTIEAGSASGLATGGANHTMPDPEPPNNLLAPWWTDLDLTDAGNWYVATVSDGTNTYTVFEWEDVPKFGDLASTATFQLWIQDGTDSIWFAYDGFTGDTSTATVGAEDSTGSSGALYYFDGAGTLPSSANDLLVEFFLSDPAEFTFQVVASGGLEDLDVLNVVTATDGTTEYAAWAFTDIEALKIYLPLIFK